MTTSLPLLKPTLYAMSDAGPVLLGGRCVCGYVFFPMQSYGCEQCGATQLASMQLQGRGTLITASIVHMHAPTKSGPRLVAPFAIGVIALDDGPIVRTLLCDLALASQSYARVHAELVNVTQDDGSSALDLRFKKSGA